MSAIIDLVGGARPNFVKLAPLWRALRVRMPKNLGLRLVHTGQHHAPELSDEFARELGLPPADVLLGVGSGTHGEQTAAILARYERELLAATPRARAVIVVGDVNSTLGCALAAAKLGIPIVHVEAGLRCFDRSVPEEINRTLTDVVSELLLASEPSAVLNLQKENIASERVRLVGSLIVDCLRHELAAARALRQPEELGLVRGQYAVVTLHRPSNVDNPERLHAIVRALEAIGSATPLVFPLHPRTAFQLERAGLRQRLERAAQLVPSQPYRASLGLMDAACAVITDSGGIQEETTDLGVPCLTLRAATERPATVELGTNRLVDDLTRLPAIFAEVSRRPRAAPAPIEGWDGKAAERAADAVCERFV